MEKTTIGKFIAQLRKDAGMTQKQLAEILNVSDKTISHWERDESLPDLSMIPIIAEVFGITCDELLKGEKREPTAENIQAVQPQQNTFTDKIEKSVRNLFDKGFTIHKILCAVACGFTGLALLRAETFAVQMNGINASAFDMIGSFSFSVFFSICIYYVIAAVMIGVSHTRLKEKIAADDTDEETKEKQKLQMNRTTAYSLIFLVLVIITTLVQLVTVDALSYPASLLILVPFDLIAATVTIVLLKHFNRIPNKQQSRQAKVDFKFRMRAIFLAVVFVACGIGAQIVVGHFDGYYQEKTMTKEEFIEYMETPNPVPSDYDGTLNAVDTALEGKSAEEIEEYEKRVHTINNDNGEVVAEFRWLNHEVKGFDWFYVEPDNVEVSYEYDDSAASYDENANYEFSVKTYMVQRKNEMASALANIMYYAAFVYYPAVVIACIVVCIVVPKRRKKRETADEILR
ncbi:MAG: helix-turn-helix domain-containing protein [Ruminococcus sp.]|nr:helix-turn-helix domain-containing protein [Ruminococcus sp.]